MRLFTAVVVLVRRESAVRVARHVGVNEIDNNAPKNVATEHRPNCEAVIERKYIDIDCLIGSVKSILY